MGHASISNGGGMPRPQNRKRSVVLTDEVPNDMNLTPLVRGRDDQVAAKRDRLPIVRSDLNHMTAIRTTDGDLVKPR